MENVSKSKDFLKLSLIVSYGTTSNWNLLSLMSTVPCDMQTFNSVVTVIYHKIKQTQARL